MPPRIPALIVFDLDGTLVDSRRDLANATNRLILELDGTPLDERTIGAMIGDGVDALVSRALAAGCGLNDLPASVVARFREIYADHLLDTTLPYPGIRAALRRLSDVAPLAVLTNKPERAALAVLSGLGLLEMFGAVLGGDGILPRKPHPGPLLHLIDQANTTAHETLLVGDSEIDFETAERAGTAIAMARYGYGFAHFPSHRLVGDEVLLDSPQELPFYLGL